MPRATEEEKAQEREERGECYCRILRTMEMKVTIPTAMPTTSDRMRSHISIVGSAETVVAAVVAETPRTP